jgi:hypothetical protein
MSAVIDRRYRDFVPANGACVFDNGGVFWSAVNVAAAVTGGRSENPAAEDSGSYNAERTK